KLPWLIAILPESDKVKPLLRASKKAQAEQAAQVAQAQQADVVQASAAMNPNQPLDSAPSQAINQPTKTTKQERRLAQAQTASDDLNTQSQQTQDAGQKPSIFDGLLNNLLSPRR